MPFLNEWFINNAKIGDIWSDTDLTTVMGIWSTPQEELFLKEVLTDLISRGLVGRIAIESLMDGLGL